MPASPCTPWRPPARTARRPASRQHDEVVAVDDLVRPRRPADRGVRRPGHSLTPQRPDGGTRPLANTLPVGAGDLDRVVGVEACPARRPRRRAAATSPRSTSARRAPSSTTTVPGSPTAKAIHSLRADSRRSWGTHDGAHARRRRRRRRPARPVAVGGGDHGAHARPGGDLGRRQLRRHAAAAPRRCRRRRPAARARGRPRRSPR